MFGLPGELIILIPDKAVFYSLYADGIFSRKTYQKDSGESFFAYDQGAVVFLFYTYPTHRAASVIRNIPGSAAFPGLSKRVKLLFTVHASKVDKLRRSIGFLNKNSSDAYHFDDDFYTRLYFLLQQPGRLNYLSLKKLASKCETERIHK